jgi:hypothetical protein
MTREKMYITIILRLGAPPPPGPFHRYTTEEWFDACVNLWAELGDGVRRHINGDPYDVEPDAWEGFWKWWLEQKNAGRR